MEINGVKVKDKHQLILGEIFDAGETVTSSYLSDKTGITNRMVRYYLDDLAEARLVDTYVPDDDERGISPPRHAEITEEGERVATTHELSGTEDVAQRLRRVESVIDAMERDGTRKKVDEAHDVAQGAQTRLDNHKVRLGNLDDRIEENTQSLDCHADRLEILREQNQDLRERVKELEGKVAEQETTTDRIIERLNDAIGICNKAVTSKVVRSLSREDRIEPLGAD